MPSPRFPRGFFGSNGLPRLPYLWFAGRLVVLEPAPDDPEAPHRFGGPIPLPWSNLPTHTRVHGILDLDLADLDLPLPDRLRRVRRLPLVQAVRHSGAELVYDVDDPHRLKLLEGPTSPPDRGWPMPRYPKVLPPLPLAARKSVPMPFDALRPSGGSRTASVQDFPEESERFLLAVVTARESTLGFSVMGPEAEDEGLQFVFLVHPLHGRVWGYHHCA